jgi:hypothetical protein
MAKTQLSGPAQAALAQAAGPLQLNAAALRACVDVVLAEELYWFPVRHHSPAAAAFVTSAIATRRPKIVFIEGPVEANDLVKHIVDSKTKPPIAIYSSYRDDANVLGLAGVFSPAPDIPPRFSCWYPLLAYSPEYAALRAAKKNGADVVFIDLPYHATLKPLPPSCQAADEPDTESPDDLETPSPRPKSDKDKTTLTRDDDHLLAESGFYQHLAKAAGYRSWDEAWDSLFEMRAKPLSASR